MCQRSSYRKDSRRRLVDSTVPLIKEEIVEVIQPLRIAHRDGSQWLINEHIVRPATDQRKNRGGASASGAHPRAQCEADTGIHYVSDQRENNGMNSRARGADSGTPVPQVEAKIAEVFQVLSQEPIHSRIVDPCFPRSAVVVKATKKGNPCRHPEEELLEAAMARAREEEHEFLQTVPQDDTMKERQAEVLFQRNPEMFALPMRHEGLL